MTVVPVVVFAADTKVGGTRVGVTGSDAAEAVDDLSPFNATAVNVYAVPFVRPVMLQLPDAPVTVQVAPSGFEVTVYPVGALPAPAATVIVASLSPATAVGVKGVPGTSNSGVKRFTQGDFERPTTMF
jgi:hypothetical protein